MFFKGGNSFERPVLERKGNNGRSSRLSTVGIKQLLKSLPLSLFLVHSIICQKQSKSAWGLMNFQ